MQVLLTEKSALFLEGTFFVRSGKRLLLLAGVFLEVDETNGEDLDDDVEDFYPVNGLLLFIHNVDYLFVHNSTDAIILDKNNKNRF